MLSTTQCAAPCLITTPEPADDDSIRQSQQWIHENKLRGVTCPTCGKHVEEYRRTISSNQALALELMYTKYKGNFVSLSRLRARFNFDKNGEVTRLAHWRLIQQHPTKAGLWAVTSEGADWVIGNSVVPQSIYTYQGELTGQCSHRISFQQAMNSALCNHGDISDCSDSYYRQPAKSSDDMYSFTTLSDRRNKVRNHAEGEDDLFDLDLEDSRPLGNESVKKSREWIELKLEQRDGGFCPSCDRIAAYNKTMITDAHARLLIEMYKNHGMSPVHVPSFMVGSDPVGKLGHPSESAHRGLLAVDASHSGGNRSGWYRLTPEGELWILDYETTPENIWSYNRFARTMADGKKLRITDVFERSDKLWYSDLISGI